MDCLLGVLTHTLRDWGQDPRKGLSFRVRGSPPNLGPLGAKIELKDHCSDKVDEVDGREGGERGY